MRGMSPVECLPGESMYGKTISSVAPASTHCRTPAAIDGSASSMCAKRTTTSGPAIAWTRLAMQFIISFAASRREPWSISRMAFMGSSYDGGAKASYRAARGAARPGETAPSGRAYAGTHPPGIPMRALRASLGAATLSLLAALPRPLAAQLDLTVNHVGIAIGDVPRVTGLRLNYRDRRLERVDGINATIWAPYQHGRRGVVRGLALGIPVTGADRIDGIGVGILGVGTQDRFRGIGIGAAGIGSGGDLEGIMIGGLGVGSGRDVTGIGIGGLGIGSSGSLRGAFVGGLGAGSGGDVTGIVVGGLGAGASGDMTGIIVGGLGAGASGDVSGLLVGGLGVDPAARRPASSSAVSAVRRRRGRCEASPSVDSGSALANGSPVSRSLASEWARAS